MPKAIQLAIPKPCHENWEQMTVQEKGRFCGSCQKTVIDFTKMSDSQILAFFRKPPAGSVCGRFNDEQLDRNYLIPRKRIPWVRYFLQVALPAFLLSVKGNTQGSVTLKKKIHISARKDSLKNDLINHSILKDQKINFGDSVRKENTLNSLDFTLKSETPLTEVLSFTLGGATASIVIIQDEKLVPLIDPTIVESEINHLNIFPNPSAPGSVIHIATDELEPGNYSIQLLTVSGYEKFQKKGNVSQGMGTMPITLPILKPGIYFICLTNLKTQKRVTQSFQIR